MTIRRIAPPPPPAIAVAIALLLTLTAAETARAVERVWDGGGIDALASTAANWVGNIAPLPGDDIVLDATSGKNMTWDAGAPSSVGSWTQVDYAGTVTVATVYNLAGFANFHIAAACVVSNGAWTHDGNDAIEANRMMVTVGTDFVLGPDAHLNANGKGYRNAGPGVGGWGYGGSHGGVGNFGAPTYGSISSPTNLGSTGYHSGSYYGGGAIMLDVAGTAALDGTLSADAGTIHGAGGSIYLRMGSVTGSGTISATGNSGGGGGRVALVVTNAGADFAAFNGAVSAYGGDNTAGAGTVYRETAADVPGKAELTVDNANRITVAAFTDLNGSMAVTAEFARIIVTNAGMLNIGAGDTLIVTNTEIRGCPIGQSDGIWISGGGRLMTPPDFVFSNCFIGIRATNSIFNPASSLTIGDQAALIVDRPYRMTGLITVADGGIITHSHNTTAEINKLELTLKGDLIVLPGGSVNVNEKGYWHSNGPGAGGWGSGASHGGRGGANALTYGSIIAPTNLGSAASGPNLTFRGGGAAILTIDGNAVIDGTVSANGRSSGDAGGSIYLRAGTLTGQGTMTAAGVSGYNGGGGGRIAVVVTNDGADFSGFTNTISTYGGGSAGAGTVYLRTAGQGPKEGTLIVDGNNAAVNLTTISHLVRDAVVGNVIIRRSGRLAMDTDQNLIVHGAWSNAAFFSAQPGGSVTFGGGMPVSGIYGDTTFGVLACDTPGKTLRFAAGSSNAVTETLAWSGSPANRLKLQSSVDGAAWRLNVAATANQTVRYVDVRDSDASPGAPVTALNSMDRLGNTNWFFTVAGVTNRWTGAGSKVWGEPANWDLGRAPIETDIVVIPAGCPRYPLLDAHRTLYRLTVESGAALGLANFDLTIKNDLTFAGTLTAAGSERVTLLGADIDFAGSVVTPARATVVFAGSTDQTINLAGKSFWNILVVNTGGVVNVNGGASAREFKCDGDGNAMTLRFAAGTTLSVRDFVANGSVTKTNLLLHGATPGNCWRLEVGEYALVRGADVRDSDAGGGKTVYPLFSFDGGNNPNWVFDASWAIWQGTMSASFETAGNWSPPAVPGSGARLLVETSNPLELSASATVMDVVLGGVDEAVRMRVNAPFTVGGDVTVRTNAVLTVDRPMRVGNDMLILQGGALTHTANDGTEQYKLDLNIGGRFTLDHGASVNMDGKGYRHAKGPGAGGWGSGASHGGRGGANAPTYGSIIAPTNLGSAASGPNLVFQGGGSAILTIAGTATINGTVSANGRSSGDAGGSIYLRAGTLTGQGAMTAAGVSGYNGGGGGRIAVVLTETGAGFDSYSGIMTAYGMGGAAAGTVYRQTQAQGAGGGTVAIDNNHQASVRVTDIPPATNAVPIELNDATIMVANKAIMRVFNPVQARGLTVASANEQLQLVAGVQLLLRDPIEPVILSVNETNYTKNGRYTVADWNGFGPAPANVSGDGSVFVLGPIGTVLTVR